MGYFVVIGTREGAEIFPEKSLIEVKYDQDNKKMKMIKFEECTFFNVKNIAHCDSYREAINLVKKYSEEGKIEEC